MERKEQLHQLFGTIKDWFHQNLPTMKDHELQQLEKAAKEAEQRGNLAHDERVKLGKLAELGLGGSHQQQQQQDSNLTADESPNNQQRGNAEIDFNNLFARDLFPRGKQGAPLTNEFLLRTVDIFTKYIEKCNDRTEKIVEFHQPHELRGMLDLEIPEKPENLEQILVDLKQTLQYGVKTGHPRFFNQLSCGMDVVSMVGEWLTATANSNMFTYEVSPVFILMEKMVLRQMRQMVGFNEGDGILAPGGSISNLYSVLLARHKFLPGVKQHGIPAGVKPCIFTSEHAHYSIKAAASLLGIGLENVVFITTDKKGKMMPEDLERKIIRAQAQGYFPFYVAATSGTTVLGAFDPIPQIADICEKYGLWLHIDAAWGGGALLSKKHKGLLTGVERADSVTWNPHKLMGVILQCSCILVKEEGLLESCNSMHADYLFQQDKHYDVSYDTGDKAIQCGRHVDVFKLWLMWRAKGSSGLESQINYILDLAKYLREQLKSRPGYEMVLDDPQFTNVCYWYLPPCLRAMPHGKERDEKLRQVAPKIKGMMMNEGSVMVGYQPLGEKVNFFRMIISNPAATRGDIDFLLDETDRLGRMLTDDDLTPSH